MQGARELIPQHFHWDWTAKAPELGVLANTFYGISYENKLQGLMKLETVGEFCRCRLPEQEGKPLVYVDYVEVAPWNLKQLMLGLGEKSRFNALGGHLKTGQSGSPQNRPVRHTQNNHVLPHPGRR